MKIIDSLRFFEITGASSSSLILDFFFKELNQWFFDSEIFKELELGGSLKLRELPNTGMHVLGLQLDTLENSTSPNHP